MSRDLSQDGPGAPGTARFLDLWVRFMLRHRALLLVAVALVTAGFAVLAARLPIITAVRDMLPDDRPEFRGYDEARERFGGDEYVVLALLGDEHFTTAGLERLDRLTRLVEQHPLIERALSLTNTDEMRLDPEDGSILIEPYLRAGASPEEIRSAALADPLVESFLLSHDGDLVAIVARLRPSSDEAARVPIVAEELTRRADQLPGGLKQLAQPQGGRRALEFLKQHVGLELVELAHEAGYAPQAVYLAGFPAALGALLAEAEWNMKALFPISVGLMLAVLTLLLRRPIDVVLPILCVMPAVLWAVALGGLFFGRISIVSSASPIMVLVVGVSDVVHLVTQFRHELGRGLNRDEAIRVAFDQVGTACALTSLTTFVGFGAMVFLPLPHSRELGVFAALGVVCAFTLSFILTPILLSFTHPSPGPQNRNDGRLLTRLLGWLADRIEKRPALITVIGLAFSVAVGLGVSGVRVENLLMQKLPPDHEIRVQAAFIEEAFGSSYDIELLVDAGAEGAAKEPAFLRALAQVQDFAKAEPTVADAVSVLDLLERMHDLMADGEPGRSRLPESRELVAQYLLLLSLSANEDLDSIIDPTGRYLRMSVRFPDASAEAVDAASQHIERFAAETLPATATAQSNGLGLLLARAGPEIFRTSLQGLATAIGLIAVIMTVRFRSLRVGLISIIPNLMPVAFGVVVVSTLLGQIDADTMAFLAVSVGIAVDDTIHFLARYRIERERGLVRAAAVRRSIEEAGPGIARTSMILIAGFGIMLISDFQGMRMMGLMLPATLVAAVVLDLTLLPAMAHLGWFDRNTTSE